MGKIEMEKKTVARMIQIYCRSKHGSRDVMCNECAMNVRRSDTMPLSGWINALFRIKRVPAKPVLSIVIAPI